MTDVRGGSFKSSVEIPITRPMRPEFSKLDAVVSSVPLGLAHGLDAYLKKFPYGCSEQVSSGAFCRLMLADEADFGLSRAEVNKQLEYTFGVLRRRQNDQGAFGYWGPEPGERISFVSVYAMDFLSEAKTAGFVPPSDMFASGLRNLQRMVTREPSNFSDARTLAYAIYVLTREGVITTNYILNLRDYLDKTSAGPMAERYHRRLPGRRASSSSQGRGSRTSDRQIQNRHGSIAGMRRFLSATWRRFAIHCRARPRISRAAPKSFGRRIQKHSRTDRRRLVRHAFGGVRGARVESVFAYRSRKIRPILPSPKSVPTNRKFASPKAPSCWRNRAFRATRPGCVSKLRDTSTVPAFSSR